MSPCPNIAPFGINVAVSLASVGSKRLDLHLHDFFVGFNKTVAEGDSI